MSRPIIRYREYDPEHYKRLVEYAEARGLTPGQAAKEIVHKHFDGEKR